MSEGQGVTCGAAGGVQGSSTRKWFCIDLKPGHLLSCLFLLFFSFLINETVNNGWLVLFFVFFPVTRRLFVSVWVSMLAA